MKPVCCAKMISINIAAPFCSVFVKVKTAEITCANKTVKLVKNGQFNMLLASAYYITLGKSKCLVWSLNSWTLSYTVNHWNKLNTLLFSFQNSFLWFVYLWITVTIFWLSFWIILSSTHNFLDRHIITYLIENEILAHIILIVTFHFDSRQFVNWGQVV